MKSHAIGAALLFTTGGFLSGITSAQNVPSQFLVTGKAAEKIQDYMSINLATAERIVELSEKGAIARNEQIASVVLDRDGSHVYYDRMDGENHVSILTAEAKASTVLMTHQPTKQLLNQMIKNPTSELELFQLGEYTNQGGLPVSVNHQIIGFLGIGGSPSHPPKPYSDEIYGYEALKEVFGASAVPPLGEDLPPTKELPGALGGLPNPNAVQKVPAPRFRPAAAPKPSIPAEFVVPAGVAERLFDANEISLATAKKLARGCRDYAASKGGAVTIYVLDRGGEVVHMERMDGEVNLDVRTALLKAQTSLRGSPTSQQYAEIKNQPIMAPRVQIYFGDFAEPGGVPIVIDGQLIGSVGVSGGGDAIGGDEKCAVEGLKAAFGTHAVLPVYAESK
jgi:uncharacterized protein GlcG (DUF336 family)